MPVAAPLALREGDRPRLAALARSTSIRAGLAQRARIILLAAAGVPNAEIARRTGTTRPTVLTWRNRYSRGGISALLDKPRSGRPTTVDEVAVIAATLADQGRPPEHVGATRWSARRLGKELGISYTTVARIWRKWGIDPQRIGSYTLTAAGDGGGGGGLLPQPHRVVKPGKHSKTNKAVSPLPGVHWQAVLAAQEHPAAPAPETDPWLRLVEISLSILTHQAIHRGTFASVRNLIEAIGALTDGWAEREESRSRACRSSAALARDRKSTSATRQPCIRSSRVTDVDQRKGSDRTPNRGRDSLLLHAEFHGTRASWGERRADAGEPSGGSGGTGAGSTSRGSATSGS